MDSSPNRAQHSEEEFKMLEKILKDMQGQRKGFMETRFTSLGQKMSSDNDIEVLQALMELNSEISMTQEEHQIIRPVLSILPQVLKCLQMDAFPEIMINASISLNHILDIVPEGSESVVKNDGLQILANKIQNLEYIDIAENAIRALEVISTEFSNGILQIGALATMLNLIHFLIGPSQKYILKIVSRIFKNFTDPHDYNQKILPAVQEVKNFLAQDIQHDKMAAEIILNLSRRIFRLYESDQSLQELQINKAASNNGIVEYLLAIGERALDSGSSQILVQVIAIFNKFAYMSIALTTELLFCGLQGFLLKYMNKMSDFLKKNEDSKHIVNEFVGLINTLLSFGDKEDDIYMHVIKLTGIKIMGHSDSKMKVDNVKDNQSLIEEVLLEILYKSSEMYESCEDCFFKYLLLTCIRKIINFFDKDTLSQNLDSEKFANFMSRVLEAKDLILVTIALLIIQNISDRLPNLLKMLTREGILDTLKNLVEVQAYIKACKIPQLTKRQDDSKGSGRVGLLADHPFLDQTLAKKLFQGKLKEKDDIDDLMKQLLSWQNNPSELLESLRDMKQKEEGYKKGETEENGIDQLKQESKEIEGEEEGGEDNFEEEEEQDEGEEEDEDFLEGEDDNYSENMETETGLDTFEGDSSLSVSPTVRQKTDKIPDDLLNDTSNDTTTMEEGGPKPSIQKTSQRENLFESTLKLRAQMDGFPNQPPSLKMKRKKKQLMDLQKARLKALEAEHKRQKSQEEIEIQKQIEVRKEVGSLAQEILKNLKELKIDGISSELEKLRAVAINLKNGDIQGISDLASIFNKTTKLTFYEFTNSNIVEALVQFLIKPQSSKPKKIENDTEGNNSPPLDINDIKTQNSEIDLDLRATRLSHYYNQFYSNDALPIKNLFKNLKTFLSRMPEVAPFHSSDQSNKGSFISELKYLSTPVKIRVTFKDSLTSVLDFEEFCKKMQPEGVDPSVLDLKTKARIYEDAVGLFDDFRDIFKQNSVILFQVERFASLKSVEKYMINKFAPKILSQNNPSFHKRKKKACSSSKKEMTEKSGRKKSKNDDAIVDSAEKEKILTKNYLERKMRDKLKWSKDKDFRSSLEKQFLQKPNKIIKTLFSAEVSGQGKIQQVHPHTTIYELVLKHQLQENSNTTINLDFGLELKTDFLSFTNPVNIENPQLDSSVQGVLSNLEACFSRMEDDLVNSSVSETLFSVLLAILMVTKLESIKKMYLGDCSSKLQQKVVLDVEVQQAFIGENQNHQKLSSLFTRVFKEPLRILGKNYPDLVVTLFRHVPEIFDFDSRYNFFKHVQFKPTRAMYFVYQANKPAFKALPSSKIGKLRRKKLKVSRDMIFHGAEITFCFPHSLSNLLEFDFDTEEGSGLGPTLEFYCLLAEEFKNDTDLWRETDDFSLFPVPVDYEALRKLNQDEELLKKWKTLGAAVARAVLDQRVFDLRISSVFWKVVLGKKCTLKDIGVINKNLFNILNNLQSIANQRTKLLNEIKDQESDSNDTTTTTTSDRIPSMDTDSLKYNGVEIQDLCLVFTLPGYDDFELVPGGINIEVTLDNLQLYIDSVTKFYLIDSIMLQVQEFREGLNTFLDLNKFSCLQPEELEPVICGESKEQWTPEYLKSSVNPSHGYGHGSPSYTMFLEVLSEYDDKQKREFLMFAIGAPRLPLGGLQALSPPLTVVKKIPMEYQNADDLLPSVMTCQNYVKLPEYSNKERLIEKLSMAIREGQHSFSLSQFKCGQQ